MIYRPQADEKRDNLVGVRVPTSMHDKLSELANLSNMSVSRYIYKILQQHLKDISEFEK